MNAIMTFLVGILMTRSRTTSEELDKLKGARPYEDFELIVEVAKSTALERIRNKKGEIICSRYFLDLTHIILFDHVSSEDVKVVEQLAKSLQSDIGASVLIDTRSGIFIYMDLKKAPNYVNSEYSCLRDHARNLLKKANDFK